MTPMYNSPTTIIFFVSDYAYQRITFESSKTSTKAESYVSGMVFVEMLRKYFYEENLLYKN